MKTHRIFIEHLPETSETEIRSKFTEFGIVTSVEIKERKNVTFKNSSQFFAYINLETDEKRLQNCFQYFSECLWNGEYVKLQIAKESFLERLKREREASNGKILSSVNNTIKESEPTVQPYSAKVGLKKKDVSDESKQSEEKNLEILKQMEKGYCLFSADDSDTKEENSETLIVVDSKLNDEFMNGELESSNIIIKNNRGIHFGNKKLKIEGVGKKPIFNIQIAQDKPKSLDKFRTEADNKRWLSLLERKREYNHKKNAIKAALSYKNMNKSNKIIFGESEEKGNYNQMESSEPKSVLMGNTIKTPLFDNERISDSDEDANKIFELREKFQGKAGEKLLKLQSAFKNDKRFVVDEKFLEENKQNEENIEEDPENVNFEEEKKKEFEILGEILGREVKSYREPNENHARRQNESKVMRRFDPSHPDHIKYERENNKNTSRKKEENQNNEKKVENKEEPEVSKEVFYAVRDDLKKSLDEDKGFSLLSTFGNSHEKDDTSTETTVIPIGKKKYIINENPFKYDSSDDEDQTGQLPQKQNSSSRIPNSIKAWTEPFFFQEDDFRLQEGMDFVKRIAAEDKDDFLQVRRNLKEIARNKVRMNLRKNRPFKRKLGGNKKKKINRINKALTR